MPQQLQQLLSQLSPSPAAMAVSAEEREPALGQMDTGERDRSRRNTGVSAEDVAISLEAVGSSKPTSQTTTLRIPKVSSAQVSTSRPQQSASNPTVEGSTNLLQPIEHVHTGQYTPREHAHSDAVGHEAPEWSNFKSAIVLLGCTLLFTIIAEVLVDEVDSVMDRFDLDEKLLGLTIFALVPSVTEFVNAIAFAVYGNVALSMEIGSAYTVQVAMLQIPATLAFSVWYNSNEWRPAQYHFNLLFPRWDVIVVVFSVFLLTYSYVEGKSNYFKGSILTFAYVIFLCSFWYEPVFGTGDFPE